MHDGDKFLDSNPEPGVSLSVGCTESLGMRELDHDLFDLVGGHLILPQLLVVDEDAARHLICDET